MEEYKNGDAVRMTRATLALVLAICVPIGGIAVAKYRIDQQEERWADVETRVRALESAVIRFESTTKAVDRQTDAIRDLEKEIANLNDKLPSKLRGRD